MTFEHWAKIVRQAVRDGVLNPALRAMVLEAVELREKLAEEQAALEVVVNGARHLAACCKPHAEREHAEQPSHDTGATLSLIRHIENRPHGSRAVAWMDEMKARAEAAEQRAEKMEKALQELVRLKDLNDRLVGMENKSMADAIYCADIDDYKRNNPLAWSAARAALQEKTK